MSIFSRIKRTQQQAKEHSAKAAEKTKEEAVKPPYKHVPTHAAVDALSGAPSSWQHEYRPRILEQNRARSALAVSGTGATRRVGSSLPRVSYPSIYATPSTPSPRNYSVGSAPTGRQHKVAVDSTQEDYFRHPSNRRKGKEPGDMPPLPVGVSLPRARPGLSSAVPNKVGSRTVRWATSSSSGSDLEIRTVRHSAMMSNPTAGTGQKIDGPSRPNSSTGSVTAHRPYTSYQRKLTGTQDRHHFTAPQPINLQSLNMDPSNALLTYLSPAPVGLTTRTPSVTGPSSSASSTASTSTASSTAPSSVASIPDSTAANSFTTADEKPSTVEVETPGLSI